MTREEAKRRSELYSALADGKTIQVLVSSGEWKDVEIDKLNCISENISFRIKPEPKYRPFKSQDECWQEMQKHQPFGWVRGKYSTVLYHIDSIANDRVVYAFGSHMTFDFIIKNYEFADGTPFGIKED